MTIAPVRQLDDLRLKLAERGEREDGLAVHHRNRSHRDVVLVQERRIDRLRPVERKRPVSLEEQHRQDEHFGIFEVARVDRLFDLTLGGVRDDPVDGLVAIFARLRWAVKVQRSQQIVAVELHDAIVEGLLSLLCDVGEYELQWGDFHFTRVDTGMGTWIVDLHFSKLKILLDRIDEVLEVVFDVILVVHIQHVEQFAERFPICSLGQQC